MSERSSSLFFLVPFACGEPKCILRSFGPINRNTLIMECFRRDGPIG